MKKNIFEYYINKFREIKAEVVINIIKKKMQHNQIMLALKEYDYLMNEHYYFMELVEENKGVYNSSIQSYKDYAIYTSNCLKELEN